MSITDMLIKKYLIIFEPMITFPNAKINLGLNILNKRSDGYHNIDSVFFPVYGLHDVLEIVVANSFSFTSTGLEIPGDSLNNLCIRAYDLLKINFDLPSVNIHLHKIIPMGAGLGGGSADGAFTINMLSELFELNLSINQRLSYASKLGSDCAFFINNVAAHASSRGEVLSDVQLDLQDKYLVLLNPGVHVGTKEAYSGVMPNEIVESNKLIIGRSVDEWKNFMINDFEKSVFPSYPIIERLKYALYENGASYASMTGSGSTVYGIFDKKPLKSDSIAEFIIWEGSLQ